ncbi:MAG TPA: metallophosphoesterase [Symbiobacteriaceae bacterium]|nr:metallophosphoesterase [Symbiobacteriaceae bacterium]
MNLRRTIRRYLRRLAYAVSRLITFVVRRRYRFAVERIPVERVAVRLTSLPPHLKNFTIGVLTDLHVGALVDPEYIRAAAARLAAERPDLIVVTGDFVSGAGSVGLLSDLLAPVRGAWGVLGNWDYDHADEMRAEPAVPLLVNRGVEAAPGLWLAGVDEAILGSPDLDAAMAGAPEGAVRILLCHEPDFADRVEARHRVALQISGHSHGGQVRLPFTGPLLLPPGGRRYVAGLYQAPHCQVYTSRGLGVAHLPVRILCPPEITVLSLVASHEGDRGSPETH